MGTPDYSAPEQFVDAKRADYRSDIFSLGRIFLFLHTGLHLHQGADINSIPPTAAIIVSRCTRANPDDRFQSVVELMDAMQSVENFAIAVDSPQQLERLTGEIVAKGAASVDEARELARYIILSEGDETILHNTIVELPPGVLNLLQAMDPRATEIALGKFSKVSIETSWPFSYTERIGNACARTIREVRVERIRGLMAATAFIVGIFHNRFAVIEQGQELLKSCVSNESALEAARLLREHRVNVGDSFESSELARLNPILAQANL